MQLTCLLQILIIYYGPMGSFMGTARAYIWRSAHYLKFTTPTLIKAPSANGQRRLCVAA
jgi:hypothetical protein